MRVLITEDQIAGRVREMAAELLRLAAVRHSARGFPFSPDSPWQREFEDAFDFGGAFCPGLLPTKFGLKSDAHDGLRIA